MDSIVNSTGKASNTRCIILDENEVYIDEYCYNMVKFFNDNGLKTKFSCQGHTDNEIYYILFDESVNKVDIKNFLSKYADVDGLQMCNFYEWTRLKGIHYKEIDKNNLEFLTNWMFELRVFPMCDRYKFIDGLYNELKLHD